METVNDSAAAAEAFHSSYLAELDGRVQRSEVVGAITLKKGNAALFYEQATASFTLVEKLPEAEAAHVFDCVAREQWGRRVMLFGHATHNGGFLPSGHATLDGNTLKIKLASGQYYRIDVDATLAHLQAFVSAEPLPAQEPRTSRVKRTPLRTQSSNVRQLAKPAKAGERPRPAPHTVGSPTDPEDESEDLTAEDLRRLRGEIPLSSAPKKKWKR